MKNLLTGVLVFGAFLVCTNTTFAACPVSAADCPSVKQEAVCPKDCDCGCRNGQDCTCDKNSRCNCSQDCKCGCQNGQDCTCGDCSKDCDCGCQNSLNEKNTQEVSPESSETSSETSIPEAQQAPQTDKTTDSTIQQ